MAEDRPLEDTAERLKRVTEDLDDLKSTFAAAMKRQPTGDIEATLRKTAKVGTLLCNGQLVSRTTYADLWTWAQEQGLVGVWFTTGDGSTTFGLPSFAGLALVGATADRPTGTKFGTATKTLTVAQLPAHRHTGGTAADNPSHTHYSFGNHGGHRPAEAPGLGGNDGARWPTTAFTFSGDVGWSGNASGPHYHPFTTDFEGDGAPLNVEAPSVAMNVLIWT